MPPLPRPPVIVEPLPCHVNCAPGPMAVAPPPPVMPRRPVAEGPPRVHHRYYGADCDVCAPGERRPMTVARAEPPRGGSAMGRPMVARLQTALAARGYYRGPADGVYTEPTRDALLRFQRDKGFAADGQLTRETARELGLGR